MNQKKSLLVILDGWGIGQRPEVDAIKKANTPYYDYLMENYPNAELVTYGEEVGLPEGQMGNSEVGHLNIGAGRVVYQELARINMAIREKTLGDMPALQKAMAYAKENNKPIHLMGLLSDGGVHAHINHLKELCHILAGNGVPKIQIHAFMDGRDTDPKGGVGYVKELMDDIRGLPVSLVSIVGRYFAMDRDLRWERIKKAYDLMVHGIGQAADDPIKALETSYASGITDEFIEPIILDPSGVIKDGDAVLFFNFRTDRPRQILRALTQEPLVQYDMKPLTLHMVTMVKYDASFNNINVIYDKDNLAQTMGEVLEAHTLSQVRIAETEKYPHVTFFFNGGREHPFKGEDRIMIPSPKVATYDEAPEMSAAQITNTICERIDEKAPDFICLNYANADMVGHTGDFSAAQKACEVVDTCLRQLIETALKHDYEIVVIADHGNSDIMINEDKTPHTAHTTNPVPIIYITNDQSSTPTIKDGKLADVATTLLALMDIAPPPDMTGDNLISFR